VKSIGYILHEVCDSSALIHWNKLRCEIRRHKFSVTAAQVSPLSRYLLLTRINIPPGLITQYSCTRTYIRACKRDACNRNRCVTRASNIIGDAGMKIIARYPITNGLQLSALERHVVNLCAVTTLQNRLHFCLTWCMVIRWHMYSRTKLSFDQNSIAPIICILVRVANLLSLLHTYKGVTLLACRDFSSHHYELSQDT